MGILIIGRIIIRWHRNIFGKFIYDHAEFSKTMYELYDEQESLSFEGYFTGNVEHWKPENAMKLTLDDEIRLVLSFASEAVPSTKLSTTFHWLHQFINKPYALLINTIHCN